MTVRGALFRKTLRDDRRGLLWWCAGFILLTAYVFAVYPSVRRSAAQMNQYIEQMPAALRALFAMEGRLDFGSVTGYLGVEVFSFMLPTLLLVFAIGHGARTIAGEEERGTLEVLLSSPVSRGYVAREKAVAIAVAASALGGVLTVALLVAAPLTGASLPAGHLSAAVASAVFLALVFGALAFAVGCATGRRGLAIAVPSAAAVVLYLVNSLAPVVPVLRGWRRLSPFYYYFGADPLNNGLNVAHAGTLLAAAAALVVAGVVTLDRRDLAV